MVVYLMKHRVNVKVLLDIINAWSRVDKNIPVSFWEKIHVCVRKNGVLAPLSIIFDEHNITY